ncbi:MAG: efflux RND transporter periplasmic adaptor subunit [Blastomonas sp.]
MIESGLSWAREHARMVAIAGAALLAALAYFLFFSGNSAEGQQGPGGPGQGPPPAIVTLDRVVASQITPNFTAPGDIVANRDSVVAAEVSGRIVSTLGIGTRVAPGTVIAIIDDRSIRLARDQAQADVTRLETELSYQERLVGRLEQLLAEEAESEAALDEARSSRDQTRTRLAAARITLETARVNLARTRIRSPFGGQLVERRIEIGEYATPGREIARIVGREGSEARVRVPIAIAGSLSPGQPVSIIANGERRESRVRTVIETGDEVSRTLEVRAPMGAHNMKIGEAISMTVPTGQLTDMLTVPRDALVLRDSGIFVYVVDAKDKTAWRVTVEVGEPDGDRVAISGPVKAGELIVVRGGERLRDGQPVTWSDKASKAAAGKKANDAKSHG